MTLRRRLYVTGALLVIVIAVAGVFLVRSVEATEIGQADEQLTSLLATPTLPLFVASGGITRNGNGFSIRFGVPSTGNTKRPSPSRVEFGPAKNLAWLSDFYVATLSGVKRHVLAKPLDTGTGSPATPEVSSGPFALRLNFVTVGSATGSGSWRAVLVRAPSSQEELVAVSLNAADATINRVRFAVLGAGLLAMIVLLAAALWINRLGLRPIAEVTEVADRITAGDRSRRVTNVRPRTEAGHLASAFNVMLDEQQSLEERLRQFVADASHELRTPLSVIEGVADLWRQGALREGNAASDAMRRIGQESARMAKLVEDLLLLARLDEGRPLERNPVDLVALTRSVIANLATTHPSRTIVFDADGPVVVSGDESALRRVIVNLVSNSVTHTPSSATVTVEVVDKVQLAVVEVRDTGPGMGKEDVVHAFDRFWRGDASRSQPGNGLGLSIVAGIVADSGGEVSLTSEPSSGTIVRVGLPHPSQEP